MELYCVRSLEGHLHRDDVPMVYVSEADARADAVGDDAVTRRISPEAVTTVLERRPDARVRLVLEDDEHYLVDLAGWRRLADKFS